MSTWPVPPGEPVVFLANMTRRPARRLIQEWIDEHRCAGNVDILGARVPREAASALRRLETVTARADDPWLAPIEVVRRLRGRREVVAAVPARVSELRARWEQIGGHDSTGRDGVSSFTRFVARQADLALSRAQRDLYGRRHKVARRVREEIQARGAWQRGIAELAQRLGRPAADVAADADACLAELAVSPSEAVCDLFAKLSGRAWRMGYDDVVLCDPGQVDALCSTMARHHIVLLWTHKSYLDGLVPKWFFYEHGLPPTTGMGGNNMGFWPMPTIAKRSGNVIIRRSYREDDVYRYAIRQYIGYLVEKRLNLEWSPEGGRSRTGKLLPLKRGVLAYVADAYLDGRADDVMIIPMAIAYDQLYEVREFAGYTRGKPKQAESLRWFLRYLRAQRAGFGRIYVNFGTPVPLSRSAHDLDHLSEEIARELNAATPVTPISLISMVLLDHGGDGMTIAALCRALEPLAADVLGRGLAVPPDFDITSEDRVAAELAALARHGVITQSGSSGPDAVYRITPGRELEAAYYRNTIVHFFIPAALAAVADADPGDAVPLRNLLADEFAFRSGDLAAGTEPPSTYAHAHELFRPALEAYLVVARALAGRDVLALDDRTFLRHCVDVAADLHERGELRCADAVSTPTMENALRLARRRASVDSLDSLESELVGLLARLDAINATSDRPLATAS